jgi:hypothetical protein
MPHIPANESPHHPEPDESPIGGTYDPNAMDRLDSALIERRSPALLHQVHRLTEALTADSPDLSGLVQSLFPESHLKDQLPEMGSNIHSLLELREGWSGYKSHPVDRPALVGLLAILASMELPGIPFQLVPLVSGGVQAEWHRSNSVAEFVVDVDGSCALLSTGPTAADGALFEADNIQDITTSDLQLISRGVGRVVGRTRAE